MYDPYLIFIAKARVVPDTIVSRPTVSLVLNFSAVVVIFSFCDCFIEEAFLISKVYVPCNLVTKLFRNLLFVYIHSPLLLL